MSFRENFTYAHFGGTISSTTLKSNPGVLHAVILNAVGATVGAIIITDAGNTVAVITPVAGTTVAPLTAIYDLRFTGPLVVSGGGSTMDTTFVFD